MQTMAFPFFSYYSNIERKKKVETRTISLPFQLIVERNERTNDLQLRKTLSKEGRKKTFGKNIKLIT